MSKRNQPELPEEADVVVVGSGAAALAAAAALSIKGLDVIILEKADCFGGTTAFSGAAMYLPLTKKAAAAGVHDSREDVLRYLDNVVGNAAPADLRVAFVDHADEALRFFEDNTHLRYTLRGLAPDYHPEKDGAVEAGRVLDVCEFDGRRLGRHFKELRAPLATHLVFGGMMVNRQDVQTLLQFGRNAAATWRGAKLIARYARDRLRWPRGTRLVVGSALVARLAATVLERGVALFLNSPVTGLVRDPASGRVNGVVVTQPDGGHRRIVARHAVVMATGGFARNETMSAAERHSGSSPHQSMLPASNRGDGIAVARSVGGAFGPEAAGSFFWTPVSLRNDRDGGITPFAHLTLDRAKPGIIAIDREGKRFTNEADSYHRFGQALQNLKPLLQNGPLAWLICDALALRRYGLGLARPFPVHRANRALIASGYLFQAPTLEALADRLGISPSALAETVARYNRFAATGRDEDFGKGSSRHNTALGDPGVAPNPCLAPLSAGPFYAVALYSGDLGTARGLCTDTSARVLDDAGQPIAGLYAVGNDMQSIMGGTYPGPGITLGPALVFAYLAASDIAQRAAGANADQQG
jgi:succinate dehydrogenase/fumarate reductase flavoprotein subunit